MSNPLRSAQISFYENRSIMVQWFKDGDFLISGEPNKFNFDPPSGARPEIVAISDYDQELQERTWEMYGKGSDYADPGELAAFDLKDLILDSKSPGNLWRQVQHLYGLIWEANPGYHGKDPEIGGYIKTDLKLSWNTGKPARIRLDMAQGRGDFSPDTDVIWDYLSDQMRSAFTKTQLKENSFHPRDQAAEYATKPAWGYDDRSMPSESARREFAGNYDRKMAESMRYQSTYKASTDDTGLSFTSSYGIRFHVSIQIRTSGGFNPSIGEDEDTIQPTYMAIVMRVDGTTRTGEEFRQQAGAWGIDTILDRSPGGWVVHGGVPVWNLNKAEVDMIRSWVMTQKHR